MSTTTKPAPDSDEDLVLLAETLEGKRLVGAEWFASVWCDPKGAHALGLAAIIRELLAARAALRKAGQVGQ